MSFFGKLGDKITSTSKDVAKKTKDLTGIAKINIQISSEEDKIKNSYHELGKLYYERFHGAPDEDFQLLCDEVTASLQVIESSRLQIRSIKGVKICSNCGAENPLDTSFCGSCGTKVEEEQPQMDIAEDELQQLHCSQCASVISADSVFCITCGEKVVHT
ncbi:RNA polymerase subunit RPABC4/transcription elongation factor Spt4 [Paenibacillus sp. DS2015]|uniref:zinc ribbon domain-containing protein n=1 Tax=Paenibacillus sp. DS2015 TaxID=3373917 RepID=UPI003D1A2224